MMMRFPPLRIDARMPESPPVPRPLDWSLLPDRPLYGGETSEDAFGWPLAPAPFPLSKVEMERLSLLGDGLLRFIRAVDRLYRQSRSGDPAVPAWVADLYDQGKPDELLRLSAMKRFRSHLPMVLRPDLLLRDDGWALCEIDAVPGGLGFTAALNRFYRENGFPVIEPPNGLPGAFLDMLRSLAPDKEQPVIAIILSDEAADYREEMAWLVDVIRNGSDRAPAFSRIFLLHPREVDLLRDRLVFNHPETGEETPIDIVYRFFELFDLPNIPKIELIQYAVKKGFVQCTPPFKPVVEEKLSLALLHHPALAPFWRKELGEDILMQLREWVPRGWIADPTPVPPQASIEGLAPAGLPVRDFRELKTLSQKERELVLKPSGFSPLGWGSRGVTIGHDHPAEIWGERLEEALQHFGTTPYLLQRFIPAELREAWRLDPRAGGATRFQARVRLCPYYMVWDDRVTLAGVLATACPANKKIIHGMKDAVLSPCAPA